MWWPPCEGDPHHIYDDRRDNRRSRERLEKRMPAPVRLGVVMDPIEAIKPVKDSTLAMLLAAQARGWEILYAEQRHLWLRDGVAHARLAPLKVTDDPKAWFTLGAARSAERTFVWKDNESVFNTLIIDAPLDFKAHYVNGGMLWEQHHAQEAEIQWLIALKLMPDYYGVRIDLAHKYRELHHCAEAIPLYKQGLAEEPSLPLARIGLVACYLETAQFRLARTTALEAKADGYSPRAFQFTIEMADSALVATDSGGGINQWTGQHRIKKP